MTSLNPVFTCGNQVMEAIVLHQKTSKQEARQRTIDLFDSVQLPAPSLIYDRYPHQLSGGQKQRVMIAMALSCHPKLLIADEPTASLDVTIQAQIMDLLLELRERFNMAILLVSHDLGVIARMCDWIAVMYLGRIVEVGDAFSLYESPKHPYTQALLRSVPIPDPRRREKLQILPIDTNTYTPITGGCRFRPRCPISVEECGRIDPSLVEAEQDHLVACIHY